MLNSMMLIDDDKVTNYINERIIRRLEVSKEIILAHNGQEGINILTKRAEQGQSLPELILVDINMPVMDGFEFLHMFNRIVTTDLSIVIIMLTTSSDKNDLEKARNYDINGYFNKPLTEEKLKMIIQEHFTKKGVIDY